MSTIETALREAVEALRPLAANADGVHPDWCDSRRRASLDNEKSITVGDCRKAAKAIDRAEEALKQQAEPQRNTKTHDLLSTMIGMFLSYREKIGYKDGSVIAKTVDEAVGHLKDWPYPEQPPTYDTTKWRLVPVEPTDEMLKAGDAEDHWHTELIYRAMLEAAPQPEAERGEMVGRFTCFNGEWRESPTGIPLYTAPQPPEQPACGTCNNNGLIGGPSFYAPDEGGAPCPNCSTSPELPASTTAVKASEMLEAYVEAIKASGEYERWHYIPEVEDVAQALTSMPEQPATEYEKQNPLGGPAKVFDAMADAIRAGDSYESVLTLYGYAKEKRLDEAGALIRKQGRELGEQDVLLQKALEVLEWVVEQGGGPKCEHESGGAVCFCKENAVIAAIRKHRSATEQPTR